MSGKDSYGLFLIYCFGLLFAGFEVVEKAFY